jgi:hypothetical protein
MHAHVTVHVTSILHPLRSADGREENGRHENASVSHSLHRVASKDPPKAGHTVYHFTSVWCWSIDDGSPWNIALQVARYIDSFLQ